MRYQGIQFGEVIGHGTYGMVHMNTWKERTVALKRIKIPSGMDKTQMLANHRDSSTEVCIVPKVYFLVECRYDCNFVYQTGLLKHPNIVSLLEHTASLEDYCAHH